MGLNTLMMVVFAEISIISISNTNALETNTPASVQLNEILENTVVEVKGFESLKGVNPETNTNLSLSYLRGKREIYTETPARRFEIVFLIGIPATYTLTKLMMNELIRYVYPNNPDRELNDTHWAYIIANTVIIPLFLAIKDYREVWQTDKTKNGIFVPVYTLQFGTGEEKRGR